MDHFAKTWLPNFQGGRKYKKTSSIFQNLLLILAHGLNYEIFCQKNIIEKLRA